MSEELWNADEEIRAPDQVRNARRLGQRWTTEGYNVVTVDGLYVVATTTSPAVAEHVVELHNRTFGDGQTVEEATDRHMKDWQAGLVTHVGEAGEGVVSDDHAAAD